MSYSVFSPVMGWLGDRYRRTWLLAGGIGVWSLATLGSGLARDYGHLALARSFLGIGEATYGVIAPTILIDLFRRDQRSRLMSAFYLAMPLGAALGIMLGPIIAKRYGWHNAFFLVGAPGLVAAFLVLFLPEPVRGASEGVDPERLKEHEKAGATPRGLRRPDGQLVVHLLGLRHGGLHLRHRRDAGLGARLTCSTPGGSTRSRPRMYLAGGDPRGGGDRDDRPAAGWPTGWRRPGPGPCSSSPAWRCSPRSRSSSWP